MVFNLGKKIITKAEQNIDTIAGLLAFFADPIGHGRGFQQAPKYIFDRLMALPQAYAMDPVARLKEAWWHLNNNTNYKPFFQGGLMAIIAAMIAKEAGVTTMHPLVARAVRAANKAGESAVYGSAAASLLFAAPAGVMGQVSSNPGTNPVGYTY